MARSFWSKKKDDLIKGASYTRPSDAVARPNSLFSTILGILFVGLLFFGVFWAARWGYTQLTDDSPKPVAVNQDPNANGPEITETSSTSTQTPSTTPVPTPSASTPAPNTTPQTGPTTTPAAVPNTGAGSNVALFFAVAVVSYLVYRRANLMKRSSEK